MAVKIRRLVKIFSVALCMVMLFECASAGLVWADAESDEESSTEVQSEIQVQGEAGSDRAGRISGGHPAPDHRGV